MPRVESAKPDELIKTTSEVLYKLEEMKISLIDSEPANNQLYMTPELNI